VILQSSKDSMAAMDPVMQNMIAMIAVREIPYLHKQHHLIISMSTCQKPHPECNRSCRQVQCIMQTLALMASGTRENGSHTCVHAIFNPAFDPDVICLAIVPSMSMYAYSKQEFQLQACQHIHVQAL
jgi:hypothetical protein